MTAITITTTTMIVITTTIMTVYNVHYFKLSELKADVIDVKLIFQFLIYKSYDQLGYKYDNLTLGGLSMDKLFSLVEQRRARERAFAAFTLKGLGFSANVRVKVS